MENKTTSKVLYLWAPDFHSLTKILGISLPMGA